VTTETEARAHLRDVRNPEREGWVCQDCPDANGYSDPPMPVRWVWQDDDGSGAPLCQWHADERVHEAIPYGTNCSRCGVDHSALWPTEG
jgi:hypothetical protein